MTAENSKLVDPPGTPAPAPLEKPPAPEASAPSWSSADDERYPLLATIFSPEDVRKLPEDRLPDLAIELRRYIEDVVSITGGHMGSNMGTVELSVALHYCFDFLRDRLVWDVSHQAYGHKILTGRRTRFRTLRQRYGISGFTRPEESPYDCFHFGHAGTSLSTSLGIACADHLKGEDRKVVAVIGDASLSSGMPFEALNHGGEMNRDLLIILNDNEMSIARSVGSLVRYLNRLRIGPVSEAKKEVVGLLESIPVIGKKIEHVAERLLELVKDTIHPGHIFEELGFKYFGPINGHDLDVLLETFGDLKKIKGTVLLHIITEKGHGLEWAKTDPTRGHGVKGKPPAEPKNPVTSELPAPPASDKVGKPSVGPKKPAYTEVFGEEMVAIARERGDVVALTAAMPDGTGLIPFSKEFPDRFFDCGIAEQHTVGLAAGLCYGGIRPVASIYSTFLQRGYDQIHQEILVQKLPVVFTLDRAGIVGEDGPTHHGLFDITYLRALPGMVLMAPGDASELRAMLRYAIDLGMPVAVRYPRTAVPSLEVTLADEKIQLGRGVLLREGSDAVLIGYGSMVAPCLEAARLLEERGIKAAVVNPRFARPLDEELILEMRKRTRLVVTAEEGTVNGGFGAGVMELLVEKCPSGTGPLLRLAVPDGYVEHGPRADLLHEFDLSAAGIARRTEERLGRL
jgi:1-deoxy-D-xylulose-5-phosphate synthase